MKNSLSEKCYESALKGACIDTYSKIFSKTVIRVFFSSVVDCGALTSPSNGEVSVNETTLEALAVYTCNSGYLLQGNNSRTCLDDGNWSSSEPACEGRKSFHGLGQPE